MKRLFDIIIALVALALLAPLLAAIALTIWLAAMLVVAAHAKLLGAMVMQRIGLTDITISYHSPQVKNRKVWGELVPYNEVWRAGANENTTISFSSDVMVDGSLLNE